MTQDDTNEQDRIEKDNQEMREEIYRDELQEWKDEVMAEDAGI